MKKYSILILMSILILGSIPVLANPKGVFLDAGDFVIVNNKQVTLVNVGEGGAILVDVGGFVETIPKLSTKMVNDIEVKNKKTFFVFQKGDRSAIIEVSFPEINSLCSNGKIDPETEEENIDCGGYCDVCPTCYDGIKNQDETDVDCGGVCGSCNAGLMCIEDNDCLDDNCYDGKCIKCKEFIKPACSNGKSVSKGYENGCHVGWECKIKTVEKIKEEKEICTDNDGDGFLGGDCIDDCNDSDPTISHYTNEILDGKDNNCNREIDEGLEEETSIKTKEEKIGFFKRIFNFLFGWLK